MSQTSTISVERVSAKIRKIVFSNAPVNLVIPETVIRLQELVKEFSEDEEVQVVIFTSAIEDFFFNHFDLAKVADFPSDVNAEGNAVWTDFVIQLAKAPFISIGLIRGRTRGGGNEMSLAFDLRYASKEKAFFGQPEVGGGVIPGGGGSERLSRFIGRDRALEVILSSADYDAETAEKFGWVTRTLPDNELDQFVNNMASRLASFDKIAIIAAKKQINRATLPPDSDLRDAYTEFIASLSFPGFQRRSAQSPKSLINDELINLQKNLGYYIGLAAKQ